jgi:hypothetical protein
MHHLGGIYDVLVGLCSRVSFDFYATGLVLSSDIYLRFALTNPLPQRRGYLNEMMGSRRPITRANR